MHTHAPTDTCRFTQTAHTYIHAYIHTYIHACMHACMHACVHTHTSIYIYIDGYYDYTCSWSILVRIEPLSHKRSSSPVLQSRLGMGLASSALVSNRPVRVCSGRTAFHSWIFGCSGPLLPTCTALRASAASKMLCDMSWLEGLNIIQSAFACFCQ